MTAATWPQAFASLLKHEGGYVNHPSDPGGRTNLGVTQRVWEEWVGHPVDEAAMRALTPAMVEPLYRKRYWDKIRGDSLPAGIDLAVMDRRAAASPPPFGRQAGDVVVGTVAPLRAEKSLGRLLRVFAAAAGPR